VEGGLEPKLKYYETFKNIEKKRTSNYNPSNHIEDYIILTTSNIQKKGKLKYYILRVKLKNL
jgi:hypothetical protein